MVDKHLDKYVNYGGEWVRIGSLFVGLGDKDAGMWLCGYFAGGGETYIGPMEPEFPPDHD